MATVTTPRSNEQDSVLERMLSAQDRSDQKVSNALGWGLSKMPGVQKARQLLNQLMLERVLIGYAASGPR